MLKNPITGSAGCCARRRKWPRDRSAAEQRDERATPHHSITSSELASSVGGTSRPRARAVLRLITNSKRVAAPPEARMVFRPSGYGPRRCQSGDSLGRARRVADEAACTNQLATGVHGGE